MKCLPLLLLTFLLYGFMSLEEKEAVRPGKDYALFFAVNKYERMSELKNPISDATNIANELDNRYGFTTEVVPDPTYDEIERKIEEYRQKFADGTFAKDGQLLVFFSGHGIQLGQNGYFMPTDADPDRPHRTALEYDYWRNEIDQIDCKHILVTVDACYSKTFDPNWENKPDRDFSRKGEAHKDQILLNYDAYRARLFWTSDAELNQTPDRSTLARQFLEGLRTSQSSTGYLTSSELFGSYLKKATPTPGGGDFGSDEPGSCFLFFQNVQRAFEEQGGSTLTGNEVWNYQIAGQICSPQTPSFDVDLTGTPDSIYISPQITRQGYCCISQWPFRCVKFDVALDKAAVGLEFEIFSGAVPSGNLYYQVDCDSQIKLGEVVHLEGGKIYTLTFCRPGNNLNEYSIRSLQ